MPGGCHSLFKRETGQYLNYRRARGAEVARHRCSFFSQNSPQRASAASAAGQLKAVCFWQKVSSYSPQPGSRKEEILEDPLKFLPSYDALFPVTWVTEPCCGRTGCGFHRAHQGEGLIEWGKCLAGSWRSKIYLFQFWQTPIFKNLALWNKEIQLGFFSSNPHRFIRISSNELPHVCFLS